MIAWWLLEDRVAISDLIVSLLMLLDFTAALSRLLDGVQATALGTVVLAVVMLNQLAQTPERAERLARWLVTLFEPPLPSIILIKPHHVEVNGETTALHEVTTAGQIGGLQAAGRQQPEAVRRWLSGVLEAEIQRREPSSPRDVPEALWTLRR